MSFPQRGEIYMVEFHAVAGSELDGPHPALVVQNNVGNEMTTTVIVAGITSKVRAAHLPTTVLVEPRDSGLTVRSLILCGQLLTTDKSRLGRFVGRLSAERLRAVDQALAVSLGLVPMPPPRRPAR